MTNLKVLGQISQLRLKSSLTNMRNKPLISLNLKSRLDQLDEEMLGIVGLFHEHQGRGVLEQFTDFVSNQVNAPLAVDQ